MTAPEPQPPQSKWEPFAWVALVLGALFARVYDLGARVMSHDESIHAYGSFELFQKGAYRHDPAYHGPLMYYVNAGVYAFFGDSDATARLAPALIGTGIVAALWLFRRHVGRKAALCAAALVAVSPTLLFYSRYIREDIYIAFFTVLWVWAAFRYLEERRTRWLYLVTTSMALAFIAKESAFLTGGIIGSFFVLNALRRGDHADSGTRIAAADLAVLMLTLVIPFAAGAAFFALGWDPVDREPGTRRLLGAALLTGALALASVVGGVWWFSRRAKAGRTAETGARDWLKMFALFWCIEILFFTSFFINPVGGLVTGIAGSAGYWLTQHGVARGSQPWFYYLVVGGLYEFLPLVAGGVAAMVLVRRARDRSFDPVATDDLPPGAGAQDIRRLFVLFAVWWTIGSWIAFGWAGERMPWLLTHQVLPLILLAGWVVARVLPTAPRILIPTAQRPSRSTAPLALGTAIALALAIALMRTNAFAGRDLASVAATAAWWSKLLLLSLIVPCLVVLASRAGRERALSGVAAGVLLLLGVQTLRTSLQLTYVNYDLATELISYAQASPDVKRIMRTIDEISERTTGRPRQIGIAFDDESAWPFLWYFREYPNARTWGTQPEFVDSAPIVLAGGKNLPALQPYVGGRYSSRGYILYWWPLQDYASLTPSRIWAALTTAETREHVWRVFFRRDYGIDLARWPIRREIQMFVRNDVAAASSSLSEVPAVPATEPLEPELTISGPFGGLPLRGPTSVAVADDGAWVIADGANHRIVIVGPDGTLRQIVGQGRCVMTDPGRPGCVDPDGSGPLLAGDGQFNEPWGVVVRANGELFVSDTWNGRVQVFDRRGHFLRKWGRFATSTEGNDEAGGISLYGPRGLAIDAVGRIVVADTGNRRILMFDESGSPRGLAGPTSDFPEFFEEPSSVAADMNRTLLVADAWNQRIVRLDNRGYTIASWRVPGWSSRSAADKPSVAVDDSGFVYASDPESGRVFVFTPSGDVAKALALPASENAPRPTGIAVDRARKKLLVTDFAAGRLLVFPLPR